MTQPQRRRKKDRRKKKRRWTNHMARRMRHDAPPSPVVPVDAAPTEVQTPRVIVKGGVRVEAVAEGLRLETEDYHCPPTHLSAADLASLGFLLDERPAPPSVALPWAAKLETPADRVRRGPAVADREWREPEGLQVGDFLVARVQGGLDIFVTSFRAQPVVLDAGKTDQLGLQAGTGRGGAEPR